MKKSFPRFRLFLILAGIALAGFVIIIRLVQVQVINHSVYERKAQDQWFDRKVLHAKRGRIFDRHGNPLAVTCQMYDLGITPKHIPESAAGYLGEISGYSAARIRRCLDRKDREYIPLRRKLNLGGEELVKLSSMSGVTLDAVQERILPFDSVDRSFIGVVNDSGRGVAGIERAYDDILRGDDGWMVTSRDALNRSVKLIGAPRRNARDGSDIYLTIDSDVQRIADFEIRRAVEEYEASGGVVIVADPRNGDILALAEHFPGSKNHILFSSSCFYEPGSTFKLITYSYLLQRGIVNIDECFDGEDGRKVFDFGVFRDDHPHGILTVKQSFVQSSNICTIKAISRGDCEDFYRFILRCGFGSRTGVELPVETGGILREPTRWTDRSLPSIAIGQEVGVTPLQMLCAYAAIANGGELFVPRVVMRVEKGGEKIKEIQPVKTRRILPEDVCDEIRDFCRDVVLEGTGRRAATGLIPVAGKTGTAQKAGENGYADGKYISSFIGFAPVENPRLVCLVLLDEPGGYDYYGGISAAPVFRKVIEGICLSSDRMTGCSQLALARYNDDREMVRVPALLRMSFPEACRIGAKKGIIVNGCGGEGPVYSQNPGPGELVPRGTEVDVLLKDEGKGKRGFRLPDFAGLTIREARRELIKHGLEVRIEGYGTVRKQDPGPGTVVRPGARVVLYCRCNYELTCPAGTGDGRS
ncbi:MAG: PASTA domain-containing protein [Candidatus Latescibacteria bacterium]|nr:PASTA domain-containing protein [bacterium]MBD3424742.1 PASTA domain-containing protein [Candidatus Latescibacterota bacterium]